MEIVTLGDSVSRRVHGLIAGKLSGADGNAEYIGSNDGIVTCPTEEQSDGAADKGGQLRTGNARTSPVIEFAQSGELILCLQHFLWLHYTRASRSAHGSMKFAL
ncbi:hypothetical protein OWR29_39140 [Actinoplanes sp. Pm04-4]|uniref:Uncharacterized protein n=1 Tax=Paractinoplanes pyxinae TaxID=2997416 RepID=A0ABT4BC36_9ACTN|nr:hypothetical protein [Actinoplanes pyxinae]MCY1144047.1 hypothetical protein [Actinoplanes pyxinae]